MARPKKTQHEAAAVAPEVKDERPGDVERHQEEPAAITVQMVRDEPQHAGGPVTADVHPDEVDSFASAGWTRKKSQ